ncbi:hypothetical protein [Geosporobacter ferrireducens]|uniref:Lipoprotein n=1 Tax=Geosporobacter ferrireducens TaxID=1424294 RepID=A0A1D8GK02_9FIRM|nr:hypothetical protein [Geosporobacter ferrireducens]AOT71236.1 hypothetical protein Gferi_17760 [Geosporobacter ferrireducens]MTI58056.1 hypothetical protein [Geosporobacter ferrireducens]
MRRFFTIFLIIVIIMVFSACSNNTGTPKLLSKEGVAPYELSESDTYLLQSLGLEKDTNIISFKAPKTARSLKVNVYVLNDNDTWNVMGGGQVSLGQDANPDDRLEGTFAMMIKDNYAIDFNINTMGRASYQTDTLDVDSEIVASSKGFLTDFQRIEINKEIPVAIMTYDSGTSMRSYTMEDFFSPSRFEEMDLVQAVTLIFTDETKLPEGV